jgi:hypothetical protein
MTENKLWKLTVRGTLVVPSATFKDADALFAKAMKAICQDWDIDVEGIEVVRR